MIIHWNEDWRINSDQHQWVIEQRAGFRKGKDGAKAPNWKAREFHSDFCRAIGCMVRRDIRALPVEAPADPACQMILQLENQVDSWFKGFRVLVGDGDLSPARLLDFEKIAKRSPHRQAPPCRADNPGGRDG